ncbi:DnaJ domain-containing protein [Hymenobacter terrestris]|uniref:DnaJ domain-containing protein n=1 Tax=Hymenobacter terrestris TaxID=2748310 RepID=A0ABX2Q1Q7_9BACT|nr:DnaJ domain-containing protein [Hymenobacter terrestris]NVO84890.1 DnaJ domain-containing protein [Hymenobacter terrestris]
MKNYYDLLGISTTATTDEIKQAYRRLSVKFHPDKNSGDSFFADMFKQINEAQEVLLNENRRAAYDSRLNGSAHQERKIAAEQAKLRREQEELLRKQREQDVAAQLLQEQQKRVKQREAEAQRLQEQSIRITKPKPIVKQANTSVTPPSTLKVRKRPPNLWRLVQQWKRIKYSFWVINIGLVLYISFGPNKVHYFRPAGTDAYVTADKGIFLRDTPQSAGKALASLPKYTYLKLVSTDGQLEIIEGKKAPWYQVENDSLQGWVWSEYIAKIE